MEVVIIQFLGFVLVPPPLNVFVVPLTVERLAELNVTKMGVALLVMKV